MNLISQVVATGLLVWFALLVLLAVRPLLSGDSALGLLTSTTPDEPIQYERLLVVVLVPSILGYYVIDTLNQALVFNAAGRPTLPEIPESLLSILTGGNGLYLAGKIAREQGGKVR
jgi:hypothetical protein